MKYEVHTTPEANRQIDRQAEYIAKDQNAPLEAGRWLERIFDAVDSLEDMPYRCPLAEENEYKNYEIRKRGVDGFNLLFTVIEDKKEAWIIRTRGPGMEVNPDRLPERIDTIAEELRAAEQEKDRGDERDQDQGIGR